MILVTGADGIVGRSLSKVLTEANIKFLPIVRTLSSWTPKNALTIDLANTDLKDCLDDYKITSIVHLAAAVPHSTYYPDNIDSANKTRAMDLNVYNLYEKLNVPLIYMSTCGLYDRSVNKIKIEDDPSLIKIESDYFAAKYDGERLFLNKKNVAILRLAAPIGAGLKSSVVLHKFISSAISDSIIHIWGSGSREQNFIDTRDVADLILKILDRPSSCLLNVAANSISMLELAKIIIELVGKGAIKYADQEDPREGETASYSIEKAKQLYDWNPKISIVDSCGFIITSEF